MKWIHRHYHWVIAILAFAEMIMFGGLLNSATVFIIPISTALGVTRGSYALATIPYSIICTLSTLLSGYLLQRFGYKRSVIVGLGLTALSLGLTACCQSLTGFCLSKILLGLGYGVCFTAGSVRIVRDWFFRHQGLVVGAVSMASGLGGSLLTVVLTKLISAFNWRIANGFLAVLAILILLCYLLLMKDRPEEMGLRPYGFGVLPKKAKVSRTSEDHWPGLTFQQWLRHPLLYLMAFSTLVSCLGIYLSSTVLLPHFQDQGMSAEEAAGYQSVYYLILAVAKLLCGWATDRVGAKPVSIFCLLCCIGGQLMLSSTIDPLLCYTGITLCGIGLSMTSIMIPLVATSLFGYRGIAGVNSVVLAMASLASIFSSPISNLVFDRCGTYTPVFLSSAVITALMVVVYGVMFVMDAREKARLGENP